MSEPITVMTWLWKGNRNYRPEHVNTLARMVARHLFGHRFVCMADEPSIAFDPGIIVCPIPQQAKAIDHIRSPEGDQYPTSYRRLWTFSAEAAQVFPGRVLNMDIDALVIGDLAPLFTPQADFIGWRPDYQWGKPRIGGGTWLLRTGSLPHIWESLNIAGVKNARAAGYRGSDQAWLSYRLADCELWPQSAGIYQAQDFRRLSWRKTRPPANAKIVRFNGLEKPWDKSMRYIDWIKEAMA